MCVLGGSTDPGWEKGLQVAQNLADEGTARTACMVLNWNQPQCGLANTTGLPTEQSTEADHQNLQESGQIQHQLTELNLQAGKGLALAAEAHWDSNSLPQCSYQHPTTLCLGEVSYAP